MSKGPRIKFIYPREFVFVNGKQEKVTITNSTHITMNFHDPDDYDGRLGIPVSVWINGVRQNG